MVDYYDSPYTGEEVDQAVERSMKAFVRPTGDVKKIPYGDSDSQSNLEVGRGLTVTEDNTLIVNNNELSGNGLEVADDGTLSVKVDGTSIQIYNSGPNAGKLHTNAYQKTGTSLNIPYGNADGQFELRVGEGLEVVNTGTVGIKQLNATGGGGGGAEVGVEDIDSINLNQGTTEVSYDSEEGATLTGTARIVAGGNYDVDISYNIPIIGSDEIVVDADASDEHIEIHLDNSVTNKLAKALVTPNSAPASDKLVGVDTSNAQEMISIGNGLSLSGGVLSASGGGGGALYVHNITASDTTYSVKFRIITMSDTPINTPNLLNAWLNTRGDVCEAIPMVNLKTASGNTRYFVVSARLYHGGASPIVWVIYSAVTGSGTPYTWGSLADQYFSVTRVDDVVTTL